MLLEDVNSLESGLCRVLHILLVVWLETGNWAVPATDLGEDLLITEGQPFEDGSIVLLGLAEEGGLLILRRDYESISR